MMNIINADITDEDLQRKLLQKISPIRPGRSPAAYDFPGCFLRM